MENIIIVFLLILIVGGAGYYIYKKKKSGTKCIGCPCANSCCGGCMQNCPKIAIHHMEEQSGDRYRNPHIM